MYEHLGDFLQCRIEIFLKMSYLEIIRSAVHYIIASQAKFTY